MNKSGFLRVLFAIVGIGAYGWLPHTAFAQRGGHGGGGGLEADSAVARQEVSMVAAEVTGYSGGHSYAGYHGVATTGTR
jgi:hypothetical protein